MNWNEKNTPYYYIPYQPMTGYTAQPGRVYSSLTAIADKKTLGSKKNHEKFLNFVIIVEPAPQHPRCKKLEL